MKRPGWDARKRNRNIGTAKRGHGSNNRMSVPDCWPKDRAYFEILKKPIELKKRIGAHSLTFLIERPISPYFYPCSVDDVVQLFTLLPQELLVGLNYFVFRHPSKKERLMRPVWGRFVYLASIGQQPGTALYVESQHPQLGLQWPKSLGPRDLEELEQLRRDGHTIVETPRRFEIRPTLDALRNTILYRTILHELGHLNDWTSGNRWEEKATADKEMFANRFAESTRDLLEVQQKIPFSRILNQENFILDGLEMQFFYPQGQ